MNIKLKLFGLLVLALTAVAACNGPSSTGGALPNDAAGTVNSVVKSLSNYEPVAVWDALPKSYQAQLTKVINTDSGLDKDTHNKIMDLAKRAGALLRDKRSILLPFIKKKAAAFPLVPPQQVDKIYDAAVTVINEVTIADISKFENRNNVDVRKFLANHGGKIMKAVVEAHPKLTMEFGKIKNVKAKQISSAGGVSTLEITDPDGKTKKMEFIKLEGRWIPKKLQDDWPKMVKSMEEQKAKNMANAQASNAKVKAALPMAEMVISQLEKIKSEQDLVAIEQMFKSMKPK